MGAGVATTVGNVYEPYLQLTHDLDLFFESIESGSTVGEAAFYSMPGQSWQSILVGDPLYRPFKTRFDRQWARRSDFGEDGQYLVLRQANRLEGSRNRSEALRILKDGMSEYPDGLALAFRIATETANRNTDSWMSPLEIAMKSAMESPGEWGLIAEAAAFLQSQGRAGAALNAYEELLRQTESSERWQRFLVDRAIPLAGGEGDQSRLESLRQLETILNPPEP